MSLPPPPGDLPPPPGPPPQPGGPGRPGWGGGPGWGGQPGWGVPPPPPPPVGGTPWHARGLRPVGEFLSASFGLVGRAAVPLLPLLIVCVTPVVLGFVAADAALDLTGWFDDLLDEADRVSRIDPGETVEFEVPTLDASAAEVTAWIAVLVVVNLVGYALATIGGLVGLWETHQEREFTTGDLVARSAALVGRLLGLGIVLVGGGIAALLVLVVVAVVAGPVAILAFLALVPLAVFLAARLAPVFVVAVAERRGPSAIGRTWALTRGHGWGVLGRTLLFGLILSIAGQVIGIPLQFFGFIGSAAVVIGLVLSTMVQFATAALGHAGSLILYDDLARLEAGRG